jgi:hypothetical protein
MGRYLIAPFAGDHSRESLLGPANGSLGLKPSEPLVFKHLIPRLAIYETKIFEGCWG